MHRRPTTILVALVATLGLTFAACGGGDDKPSADELSKTMQDNGVPKEQADCVAGVMVDSDLSDDALNALAKGADGSADPESLSEEDQAAYTAIIDDSIDCVSGADGLDGVTEGAEEGEG